MEEVGAAVVAGCKAPPVLLSGKERLDCVTLAIQPLAVMDWFLAAATGRDARREALLDQHLTDFVPVLPLIADHRGRRRQVLAQHISTGEATALPLTQVESQGTTFYCHRPHGACWSCPPWCHQSGGGHPPSWRQSSAPLAGGSAASDADNSEKISSKTPLSHQRQQRL